MAITVYTEQVDIYTLPSKRDNCMSTLEITFGDLHANAIKLLYMLIREGVCDMSQVDYQRLVVLYLQADALFRQADTHKKTHDALSTCLLEFKTIVANLCLLNPTILVRLLGDELSDRGCNDWFILLILTKLHDEQVPLKIILSNHLADFIEAVDYYNERLRLDKPNPRSLDGCAADFFYGSSIMPDGGTVQSLTNLSYLIQYHLLAFQTVQESFNWVYKNALCLLDTSTTADETMLYSHAPIGIKVIQSLASCLDIPFEQASLAVVVQQINHYFYVNYFRSRNKISSLYYNVAKDTPDIQDLIRHMLWNRDGDNERLLRFGAFQGERIVWVHGHDLSSGRPKTDNRHVINLDNLLGKQVQSNQGEYKILLQY